jgi:hypothetical protein
MTLQSGSITAEMSGALMPKSDILKRNTMLLEVYRRFGRI